MFHIIWGLVRKPLLGCPLCPHFFTFKSIIDVAGMDLHVCCGHSGPDFNAMKLVYQNNPFLKTKSRWRLSGYIFKYSLPCHTQVTHRSGWQTVHDSATFLLSCQLFLGSIGLKSIQDSQLQTVLSTLCSHNQTDLFCVLELAPTIIEIFIAVIYNWFLMTF